MFYPKLLYLTSVSLAGYSSGVFYHKWVNKSYIETVSATNYTDLVRLQNTWLEDIGGFPQDEQYLRNSNYAVNYDYQLKIPRWVVEPFHPNVEPAHVYPEPFIEDLRVEPTFRSEITDFDTPQQPDVANRLEAGCLVPPLLVGSRPEAGCEAFRLSNAAPQYYWFKVDLWKRMDNFAREIIKPIYIVSGPLFTPIKCSGRKFLKYRVIGPNQVAVPTNFFKMVIREDCDNFIVKCRYGQHYRQEESDLRVLRMRFPDLCRMTGLEFSFSKPIRDDFP